MGMRLKPGTLGTIARRKNPSTIERDQRAAFQIEERSSGIDQPIRRGVNIDEKKMTWMRVHTLRNVSHSESGVACKAIIRGTTRKRNEVERN